MRLLRSLTLALISFVCLAQAWSNEDHEIFDLVEALETAEGAGTTFYSFLNVTKSASDSEIARAFRRRSLELHPDKNAHVRRDAHERFARLGTIAAILRDVDGRKRYDHFHDNGVPKWRGTGYYYSRYRPGLGSVLAVLAVFSCAVQYLFMRIQHRLDLKRVRAVQRFARQLAWGPSEGEEAETKKAATSSSSEAAVPRKRVKVPLSLARSGAPAGMSPDEYYDELPARVRSEPKLDMVVERGHHGRVFLLDAASGQEHELDERTTARSPAIAQTWLPRVVVGSLTLLLDRAGLRRACSSTDEHPSTTAEPAATQDDLSGEDTPADSGTDTPVSSGAKPRGSARQRRRAAANKRK